MESADVLFEGLAHPGRGREEPGTGVADLGDGVAAVDERGGQGGVGFGDVAGGAHFEDEEAGGLEGGVAGFESGEAG